MKSIILAITFLLVTMHESLATDERTPQKLPIFENVFDAVVIGKEKLTLQFKKLGPRYFCEVEDGETKTSRVNTYSESLDVLPGQIVRLTNSDARILIQFLVRSVQVNNNAENTSMISGTVDDLEKAIQQSQGFLVERRYRHHEDNMNIRERLLILPADDKQTSAVRCHG